GEIEGSAGKGELGILLVSTGRRRERGGGPVPTVARGGVLDPGSAVCQVARCRDVIVSLAVDRDHGTAAAREAVDGRGLRPDGHRLRGGLGGGQRGGGGRRRGGIKAGRGRRRRPAGECHGRGRRLRRAGGGPTGGDDKGNRAEQDEGGGGRDNGDELGGAWLVGHSDIR